MRRREFLQNTSAATALALTGSLGLQSFTSPEKKKHITILHTNDVHSHIDPFGPNDGRNANKGGIARRATLIDSIRKENPNTLFVQKYTPLLLLFHWLQ